MFAQLSSLFVPLSLSLSLFLSFLSFSLSRFLSLSRSQDGAVKPTVLLDLLVTLGFLFNVQVVETFLRQGRLLNKMMDKLCLWAMLLCKMVSAGGGGGIQWFWASSEARNS